MAGQQVYRLNEPKVVSETLDGETIVINLDTGSYFSLNATASMVWDLLVDGYTRAAMVSALGSRFDVADDRAEQALDIFIAQALEDGLIAPASGPVRADLRVDAVSDRLVFEQPVAQRYDDMRELLLADPIHDVSSAGWPHLPPN